MNAAARLERARSAQAVWAALDPATRARRLDRLRRVLADASERIADAIHDESGKPRTEALLHEVVASIGLVRHLCDIAPRTLAPEDRSMLLPHRRAHIHHRPFGVVLHIGPWNVPLFIPLSSVLPALLAGNAVLFKPSERTPRTGDLLGGLLAACDLPDGLVQIVQGDGAVAADLVAAGPDLVLFTGSVGTGRKVMAACAAHPIPCSLELGGVDAMIVRADADLEATASAIAWGATFNGGQACCSVERLLVHRDIASPLLARVEDRMRRIDPTRDLGPAIDERQRAVWLEHVADARARGLELRCGGDAIGARGVVPTLVTGAGVGDSVLWRDESFGPLLAARSFTSDDEAIALHNDTPFGLTASVFTADVAAGRHLATRLRAGAVAINEVGAMVYASPELPWGGVGHSGFGRSHGREGLLGCTWPQVIEEPRGLPFGPKRPWTYPYDADQERAFALLGRALAASPLGQLKGLADFSRAIAGVLSRSPRL